jgi:hypothetical protein
MLGRATGKACCPLESLLEFAHHESSQDTAYLIILPTGDKTGEEATDRLRKNTGQEVLIIKSGQLAAAGMRDEA